MSSANTPRPRPSLLDRLLDESPQIPRDPPLSTSQAQAALREAVRRDLENLLNSRCLPVPRDCEELDDSLISYGLRDLASIRGAEGCEEVCRIVKAAIENHEPRLRNVVVEPVKQEEGTGQPLAFRISATLHVEPWLAPIVFDSAWDAASGPFQVTRGLA